MSETKLTYKSAGVDVDAGYESVSRMKKHIQIPVYLFQINIQKLTFQILIQIV